MTEEWLYKALGIARQQEAKSLELRVVMSLRRLWHAQRKKIQAHQLLAEVYDWFTEGFDTTDLREAQALLAALVKRDRRLLESSHTCTDPCGLCDAPSAPYSEGSIECSIWKRQRKMHMHTAEACRGL